MPEESLFDKSQHIALTPIEGKILTALMEEPLRVWSRQELLDHAAGPDSPSTERVINVHISSLRRKLGDAGRQIEAVRGHGYRFVALRKKQQDG